MEKKRKKNNPETNQPKRKPTMVVHSLFILTKAGSLMYHHDFIERPRLDDNSYLRLASAFHAFFVISTQLAPLPQQTSSGIRLMDTTTFRLCCFQTLTGVKFWLTADPHERGLEEVLQGAYAAYCDYCLKNPFYELEQVVRQNAKFDAALQAIVLKHNK